MKRWSYVLAFAFIPALTITSCEPRPEKVTVEKWSEAQPKLVRYMLGHEKEAWKVKEEKFYSDGTREYVGVFDEVGKRHGEWRYYYPSGQLWSLGNYDHGMKTGRKEVYWPDGTRRYEGHYENDQKTGNWIFYNTDGSVLERMTFREDKRATP